MATGDPYATPDQLRAYLRLTSDDMSDDEATTFLQGATAAIVSFLGWDIWQVTDTVRITNVRGGDSLALPVRNLTAVTAIRVTPSPHAAETVDADRYTFDKIGWIELNSGWTFSHGRKVIVEIDGTWGWNPLPNGAVMACVMIAGRAQSNPDGVQSETVGGVAVRYPVSTKTGTTLTGFSVQEAEEDLLRDMGVTDNA